MDYRCIGAFGSGCGLTDTKTEKQRPFVFNQPVLRQEDQKVIHFGNCKAQRVAIRCLIVCQSFKNRLALLYKDGKPTFRILRQKHTYLAMASKIELIDGVTMRALDDSGQVISQKSNVWRPTDEMLLVLKGDASCL